MPRTIDSPAIILPDDAPHPDSYRPDLPLRSELRRTVESPAYRRGYDEGYDAGLEDGRPTDRSRIEALERQLAEFERSNRELSAQLAAKAS
jgi:hypothetical protein